MPKPSVRVLLLALATTTLLSLAAACRAQGPIIVPNTAVPFAAPSQATPMPTIPAALSNLVTTKSGTVRGVLENGLAVFKGIPYAASPVGELRWREPQPVAPWQDVRDADAFGDACVQVPSPTLAALGGVERMSEDCLYLNVWTPNTNPSAKLPVMVWIHGGALVNGASSVPLYSGAPLAQDGAVVVNLNYRLGPLGFFSHPALDQNGPSRTVNFGLMDQIAALRWVQDNIAAFGGDPHNVMIFGESAGGQSVLALFASPLAKGLFAKGAAQSPYGVPSHTRAQALKSGIAVADAVGLDGANATLEQLRAVPAEKFVGLRGKDLTLAPSFVAGDDALPQPILDVFEAGKQAPLPLIIGSNSDEATVATAFGFDPADLIKQLGLASIALKPLYPGVDNDTELGSQLIRDLIFTAFVRRISDLHSKVAPSWRYYFTYVPVNRRAQEPGVPHGGEIAFVMDTAEYEPALANSWSEADTEMARKVSAYWHAFASTSKPEVAGEPAWLPNSASADRTLEFGDTIAMQDNLMGRRLGVFIGLQKLIGRFLHRE